MKPSEDHAPLADQWGVIEPPTAEEQHKAALRCAANARDTAELRTFLSMLGVA